MSGKAQITTKNSKSWECDYSRKNHCLIQRSELLPDLLLNFQVFVWTNSKKKLFLERIWQRWHEWLKC